MVATNRTLDSLQSAKRGHTSSRCAEGGASTNRLSVALLLAIALIAGITAGTMLDRPTTQVTNSGLAGGSNTARAFYDALNQALAGGSVDPLAAVLAPSFVDHDSGSGESRSANEFLDFVRMLGQTPNVPHLAVDTIEMSGSSLIVQLSPAEIVLRRFAGISMVQAWERPVFEALRVAQGRVLDRWTSGIRWLQAVEFDDIVLRDSGLTDIVTTLVRVVLPPEAPHHWNPVGSGSLLIESGSARMQTAHVDGDVETLKLDPGSAVAFESGDRIELWPADGEQMTALVYLISRPLTTPVPLRPAPFAVQNGGANTSVLWSKTVPRTDEASVHRQGSMVLRAGEEIRLTDVSTNSTLILCLDAGAVEIAAPGGAVSVPGEDYYRLVEQLNFAHIDAARAASLIGASTISLRNVSQQPVTVVLVVNKVDEQGGPPIG